MTLEQEERLMFGNETAAMVQEEFSHLSEVIHLNTALTSVTPRCVQRAYEEEMKRFLASFGSEADWATEREQAREGIARLIGAGADEIALLSNTTEGIGIFVRGYPWEPDKNIVVYNREHLSNLLPWLLARDAGAFQVKLVEAGERGLRADDLLAAMDDKTQAVAVSAVQFSDGAFIDLKRVGDECRRRGIRLIVDGIQAVGRLKIDVEEMKIDLLACGGHKGLLVRNGIGFAYCRRDLLASVTPVVASYHSVSELTDVCVLGLDEEVHWHKSARKLENGNRNHPGVCGLIASTALLNEIGPEAIEEQITALQKELMGYLGPQARLLYPVSDGLSGIVRVNFRGEKRAAVEEILRRSKVYATVRSNNVRFCISFFNTVAQMRILADVMRELFALSETCQ